MRKKLLLILLALACAVCCAFGLAACGEPEKYSCTLDAASTCVSTIQIGIKSENKAVTLSPYGPTTTNAIFEKGKTYDIHISATANIVEGSARLYINGSEYGLNTVTDAGSTYYACQYAPTANFTVKFTGTARGEEGPASNVGSIEIMGPELIHVGQNSFFSVILHPNQGAEITESDTITATADNANVTLGNVHRRPEEINRFDIALAGVHEGEAVITVTAGSVSEPYHVVIGAAQTVDSVTFDTTAVTLEIGDEFELSATVSPSDDDIQITYTSDNRNVADIEYSGVRKIVAKSAGTATITAKAGDKTATCQVTVLADPAKVEGSAGLTYEEIYDSGKYKLTGIGTCTDTEITVANYYNGGRVTEIGYGAIKNNYEITSVTIPDGIKKISVDAFDGCNNLTSLTLGAHVTQIDSRAFNNTRISEITYTGDIAGWCQIEGNGRSFYMGNDGISLYVNGQKIEGALTIPEGVTSITREAFAGCLGITSVSIPNGVTSIGMSAFANCRELTSITLPDSVTSIGHFVFGNCFKLADITLSANLKSIGGNAFKGCKFANITLPAGLTSIDYSAFEECVNLTELNIPASVTSIAGDLFWNCYRLASITVDQNNTAYASQNGILYDKAKTQIISIPQSLGGDITIPDGITSIGERAFEGAGITSVSIPASVTGIGDEAFAACHSLTSVTIANGVQSIGREAFYNCDRLLSVTIPASVTSVGYEAFGWCYALTTVTITSAETSVSATAFNDCVELTTVNYPAGFNVDDLELRNCSKIEGTTVGNVEIFGSKLLKVDPEAEFIIIPEQVKSVRYNAFSQAPDLKFVYTSKTLEGLSDALSRCPDVTAVSPASLGEGDDLKCNEDGWIYKLSTQYPENERLIILGYIGLGGEVTVPATIAGEKVRWMTCSGNGYVFFQRTDITKIKFNSSISVSPRTFTGMTNLTEVAIGPNAVFTALGQIIPADFAPTGITLEGDYSAYTVRITDRTNPLSPTTETKTVANAAELLAILKNAKISETIEIYLPV